MDSSTALDRIQKVQIGSSKEEITASLNLIVEIYPQVRDKNVREQIRQKVNDILDFIFENGLSEQIELTQYMLMD